MTSRSVSHDPEAGFTLTEVVAALIILATAIIAVIGAIGSSIIASDVNKKSVNADAVVRSYAEAVTSHWRDGCSPDYSPGGVGFLPQSGFTASVVSVEWWEGNNPATFSSECPPTAQAPDADRRGLQRVTIEAHSGDQRGRTRLQVVVRRGDAQ